MSKIKTVGQSISEFAIGITVVVMALVGMRLYLQRNLQANYRQGVKQFFTQLDTEKANHDPGHQRYLTQYEALYHTDSSITENSGVYVTATENNGVYVPARGRDNIVMRTTAASGGIIDIGTQRTGVRVTYE